VPLPVPSSVTAASAARAMRTTTPPVTSPGREAPLRCVATAPEYGPPGVRRPHGPGAHDTVASRNNPVVEWQLTYS
jgi:hypothetical protein